MTLCLHTGKHCECQPQNGVACPHIPRFDIELGGYGRDSIAHICKPDGEWVRWREVERVILDPLRRCPADGVPLLDAETKPQHTLMKARDDQ
jgi:hypothetical protein